MRAPPCRSGPAALVRTLLLTLCLAAAPLPAAAQETLTPAPQASPAQEAESFYQSVLGARDAATLQAYLDCFSDERQQALWALLTPAQQQTLQRYQAELQQPSPTATQAPAPTPQPTKFVGRAVLNQHAAYDAATATYTLTTEAWLDGPADPMDAAVLCLRLAAPFALGPDAAVQVWGQDKTADDWAAAKLPLPAVATSTTTDGVVTLTGFDYAAHYVATAPRLDDEGRMTFGRRLVLQLTGLTVRAAESYGGQALPVCAGGLYTADDAPCAAITPATADVAIAIAYAPQDQVLAADQGVNFGYMLNPPGGSGLPDGQNNAWVDLCYTIQDAAGDTVAAYTLPHGAAMAHGSWSAPLPDPLPRPASDTFYTVTVTASAAAPPALKEGARPAGADAWQGSYKAQVAPEK